MPLLVCPNDSASMQTVHRNGVEFDFCPVCRGVWLDRGELEKLMAVSNDGPEAPPPRRADDRDRDDRREREQRAYDSEPPRALRPAYRDDDDYDRGYGGARKKKGFSLFDIFD